MVTAGRKKFCPLWLRAELFLLLAVAVSVQAIDPQRALTQSIHQSWGTNEGLPQDSVNAIVQTPDGYLWLATQEGIARFDGIDFTIFDPRTTNGVVESFVDTLFVDHRGTLWAGGADGLLRYDGNGGFVNIGRGKGWPGSTARCVSEDSDGALWIGMGTSDPTRGKGLIRFRDGQIRVFTTRDGLAGNQVHETAAGRAGSVWIGTNDGLSVFRDGVFHTYGIADGLPSAMVEALQVDRRGDVWVGTPRGLARLRDGTFTTFTTREGLPDDRILSLLEDRDGALWIGTAHGLARHHDGAFESASTLPGIGTDAISEIFEDRESNIWIGTHASGAHRLRAGKFTPYGKPEGIIGDNVIAIAEDRAGNIWVAAAPGAITVLRQGKRLAPDQPLRQITNDARAMLHSRDGSIWIGTTSGLFRVHEGRVARFETKDGLPSTDIKKIYEDSRGTLWIGTEAGLARFNGKSFEHVGLPAEAPHTVRVIYEDRHSVLWIGGTDGVGSLIGGRYVAMPDSDLAKANITSMLEEADGTLWFTTWSQGLFRFREGRMARVRAKDGLYDDIAWSILDDGRGNFWFNSNRGIYRVSKAQLSDFADRKRAAIDCIVYGTADGMRTRETNLGGNGALRSRDGRLWFPTPAGVVAVDPKQNQLNTLPPPVVIQRFVANEKLVAASRPDLEAGTRSIEIHYAALSFVAPERVRYRYRLEGFDDHWVEAGARRRAFFTNIDPGAYRFRVMAANDDGVWNERGAAIEFRLRSFFYQTPWFMALSVIAMILLGVGLKGFIERQRRIRHQMHHDPLTGLPNRVLLAQRAELALANASRSCGANAVLFLDLDGFKRVNDLGGHAAGDQLLRIVATRLGACIREHDTLARIGGDEFAVLLAGLSGDGRAAAVAERMIAALREPIVLEGHSHVVGVSIGIALHSVNGDDIGSILQAADRAMYRAKLAGGSAYRFSDGA